MSGSTLSVIGGAVGSGNPVCKNPSSDPVGDDLDLDACSVWQWSCIDDPIPPDCDLHDQFWCTC